MHHRSPRLGGRVSWLRANRWIAFQRFPRRGRARPPTNPNPRAHRYVVARLPADPSRRRTFRRFNLPVNHRQGLSPCAQRTASDLALPDFSQADNLLLARRTTMPSPTTHPPLGARALSRRISTTPRRVSAPPEGADRGDRVADEPGGVRPKPFASLSPSSRPRRTPQEQPPRLAPRSTKIEVRTSRGHPGCRGSSGDERVALARAEGRRSHAPAKGRLFTSVQ